MISDRRTLAYWQAMRQQRRFKWCHADEEPLKRRTVFHWLFLRWLREQGRLSEQDVREEAADDGDEEPSLEEVARFRRVWLLLATVTVGYLFGMVMLIWAAEAVR